MSSTHVTADHFQADDFVVELDGVDVQPESVSSAEALEFAASVLHLVIQVAKRNGQRLTFSGIEVVDKCTALVVRTSDPAGTEDAARTALRLVSGADDDRQIAGAVDRVRRARAALPPTYTGHIRVGPWTQEVKTNIGPPPRMPTSIEVLRAVPVRVGGAEPAVRFTAPLEARAFTLDATEDQARAIGAHLYEEVEIEGEVTRAATGEIESGRLLTFHLLDGGSDVGAWRRWYEANAARFDDVEDIEAELGRD